MRDDTEIRPSSFELNRDDAQRIDRYIIRRVLGTGAMGAVYAAWDPKLHREVAIKVVATKQRDNSKGRSRFEREARAIAALRHPNIVQIFDYSGPDSEDMFLVIEKLEGHDLYETLAQTGKMPEAVVAAIGHELCLALEVAHNAGIIHRDLKPENVFMQPSGRVVLTDFGIVKAVRDDSAVEGFREQTDVIGTPGFMPPELMRGRGLGPSTDIFALGALMYNVATGKMPFAGRSAAAIYQAAAHGQIQDPREINPHISSELAAIILSCLARNPRKRPQSAQMLRVALKGVLEDLGCGELRDDLHDFVHAPEAFAHRATRRAVKHTLQLIKLAVKDHDRVALRRYKRRLEALDPFNDELQDISGAWEGPNKPSHNRSRGLPGLSQLLSQAELLVSSGAHRVQHLNAAAPNKEASTFVVRWGLGVVVAVVTLFGVATIEGTLPRFGAIAHARAAHNVAPQTSLAAAQRPQAPLPGVQSPSPPLGQHTAALVDTPIVETAGVAPSGVAPVASRAPTAQSMAGFEAPKTNQGLLQEGADARAAKTDLGDAEPISAVADTSATRGAKTDQAPSNLDQAALLKPATAWVELTPQWPGAQLYLDNEPVSWAIAANLEVAPGRHLLDVVTPEGRHVRRRIQLAGGDHLSFFADNRRHRLIAY